MATVTLAGVPPWDGDYELDQSYFTNGELRIIKQLSGVRGGELQEAIEALDNDVLVALALIAVKRSGRRIPADALWDANVGAITFDFTAPKPAGGQEEPGDAVPPTPGGDGQNGSGAASDPSGSSSRSDGGPPESPPSPTGPLG